MLKQNEIDIVRRMRPTVNKNEPVVIHTQRVTWSGSGASLAVPVVGALPGDYVIASIEGAPTEAASLVSAKATAGVVTVVLSAANTSNDAVIVFTILR